MNGTDIGEEKIYEGRIGTMTVEKRRAIQERNESGIAASNRQLENILELCLTETLERASIMLE